MRLVVNTDGGSRGNPGEAGYGFVIRGEDGRVVAERGGHLGHTTNNVAEYTAVLAALELIAESGADVDVEVRADSRLIVEQLSGRWKIKNSALQALALRVKRALDPERVRYVWVPRAQNADADALANAAMDTRADVARGGLEGLGGVPVAHVAAAREAAYDAVDGVSPVTPDPVADVSAPEVPWPAKLRRKPSGALFHFGSEAPVTLVFVRHGETAMTEANGFSGGSEPGPPLSARGREQAGRVAALLERVGELWRDVAAPSAIWASPMVRTQETAAAIGELLGLAVETEEDLREVDFGRWQGLTSWEINDQFPGRLEAWYSAADVAAPDGESPSQVEDRVVRVARRALAERAGETVVLVCHSAVTKVGVSSLVGLPPESWQVVRVPPASVSIVRVWPDARELVVAGLPSELAEEPEPPLTLF